jgi:hypothetical protein
VDNKLLPNCPITREDILAAEHIFGPDVGSLKGKTVHRAPKGVNALLHNIPPVIMSRYREIAIGGGIMFVNKILFFMTVSRNIRFATSESLANQSSKTITQMMMDGQFENLRGDLAGLHISLNTVSNNKHFPDIEQHIQTMKEQTRSTWNMLPFKRMPTRLTIKMVSASMFWWNSFPPEGGVSETLSPRAIVVGMEIDFNKHCQLEFGTYVQTHKQSDNSMQFQTTGAIAMRPTGNEQGGYYFFSLTTGRCLNCNCWTELPIPSKVVNCVHFFACANKQGLNFGNCNGVPDDEDPFDSDGDSYNFDDDSDDGADDGDDSDDGADADSADYDSNDNDDAVNNNATIPTAGVDAADNNAADDNNNSLSDSLDSPSLDKEDNNSNEGQDSSEDNNDNDSDDSGDNAGTNDAKDKDDDYKDEN